MMPRLLPLPSFSPGSIPKRYLALLSYGLFPFPVYGRLCISSPSSSLVRMFGSTRKDSRNNGNSCPSKQAPQMLHAVSFYLLVSIVTRCLSGNCPTRPWLCIAVPPGYHYNTHNTRIMFAKVLVPLDAHERRKSRHEKLSASAHVTCHHQHHSPICPGTDEQSDYPSIISFTRHSSVHTCHAPRIPIPSTLHQCSLFGLSPRS